MAQNYGPKIVRDGLILNLDAADKNSYPGSGTNWYDTSGNGIVCTLSSATFDSGNIGAFNFSGNASFSGNSYANVGVSAYNLGIRRYATFTGWIASTSSSAYLFSDWSNNLGMALRFNSLTASDFYVYGNNRRITVSYNFTVNTWYHHTGVMEGPNMYMYINGVLVGTQTLGEDIGSSSATLKIGARGDLLVFGNQKVATAQIYNRALSQAEIRQNYNLTKSRFGL